MNIWLNPKYSKQIDTYKIGVFLLFKMGNQQPSSEQEKVQRPSLYGSRLQAIGSRSGVPPFIWSEDMVCTLLKNKGFNNQHECSDSIIIFLNYNNFQERKIIITYKDFINNILETRGRFACGEEYYERHHILPRSCGGTNDKDNLIDLFAQEHFIAHRLLAEENPENEKLISAYAIMAFASNKNEKRYKLTPEEYEQTRITFSNSLKKKYKNKENHPSYGTHISEERKRKIGEANKGNKYCVGRRITDETKKKIGDANRNPCEETRMKMSKARKGKKLGASNSNAKSVIRLSDGRIYGCAKDAAIENNINYKTFISKVQKDKGFMYYDKWLQQNNLEK